MKQPHSTHSSHTGKSRPPAKCDEAIRHCEQAAARLQAASEELAACWTALGIEIATGASRTEVLRRRAWCNVLELRVREKTSELEVARKRIDSLWNQVIAAARTHEMSHRGRKKPVGENLFAHSWTLLLQPKGGDALQPQALALAK